MPGKPVTDKQYGLYMQARNLGKSQEVASAKAGISIRTGRNLEKKGCLPSKRPKRERKHKKGIFDEIWEKDAYPLRDPKERENTKKAYLMKFGKA